MLHEYYENKFIQIKVILLLELLLWLLTEFEGSNKYVVFYLTSSQLFFF